MNSNNTQPGVNDNGQSFSGEGNAQKPFQPTKVIEKGPKGKKTLIITLILVLGIGGIAAASAILLMNKKSDDSIAEINYEEDNKLTMDSLRAVEADPTSYTLDDALLEETEDKAAEYLDAEEMNTDALMDYFDGKIKSALAKNKTDDALKILWREQDIFLQRGFEELALQALLNMDESKLVKFQKIYLYRAIVSMADRLGDTELEEKYAALVFELDPPEELTAGE